jgi:hypothetical protein
MRIDNSYLSSLGAGGVRGNLESADTTPKGDARIDSPAAQATTHIPSPELSRFRQLLQSSPDTRPDVVARVAQLLQSGYYTTPDAAEQTSDAMIRAIE